MKRVKVLSQQVQPASVAAAEGPYVEPQHFPTPKADKPGASTEITTPALNVVSAVQGPEQVAAAALDKGYVIVEDLIDAATLDAINKEFQEAGFLFAGEKDSFAGYDTFRNAAAILGLSKTAQQLATHPVIVNAVKQILLPYCKRVKLGTCTRICKFPKRTVDGKPEPPQTLHRDDGMFASSDWPYAPGFKPEFLVSVMWAVTDFTKENGATFVVPGSHKWQPDPSGKRPAPGGGKTFLKGAFNQSGEGSFSHEAQSSSVADEDLHVTKVTAEMKAGSAVVWLGSTLHGAGQHNGEEKSGIRDGMLAIYNLGWLNNEQNWHFTIPLDVQKGFSEELKDLLGHRDDGTKTDHPWITGPIYTLPYQGDADALDDISGGSKSKSNSETGNPNHS